MNGPARAAIFSAMVVCAASSAQAQPIVQPAPAPIITAETEHWYQTGEPLVHNGNIYYRAGAPVYFNGYDMVRTGSYKGVSLYAGSIVEPFSPVFVPIPGGFMQPYERRTAETAGITASSAPSSPIAFLIDTGRGLVTAYPVVQAAAPPMAIQFDPMLTRSIPDAAPLETAKIQSPRTSGRVADAPAVAPKPVVRRPRAANGVFVEFDGARWFSSGPAATFDARDLTRVGELHGLPVYAAPGRGGTIFVPVAEGLDLVAPYSKRAR
jgi:hypothetical protein